MGKCDSKSYLLFILSRINCLDETKSSIEDHSGGWTQYEKSFVVRALFAYASIIWIRSLGIISAQKTCFNSIIQDISALITNN